MSHFINEPLDKYQIHGTLKYMLGISSLLANVLWRAGNTDYYKDKGTADAVQQLADDEKALPLKETFQKDASRAQKAAADSQVGSMVTAVIGAGCMGVAHYATGTKFALETADIVGVLHIMQLVRSLRLKRLI